MIFITKFNVQDRMLMKSLPQRDRKLLKQVLQRFKPSTKWNSDQRGLQVANKANKHRE